MESKINDDFFETPSKSVDEEERDKESSSKETESRNAFNLERQSVSVNLFGSKDASKAENNNESTSKSVTKEKKTPECSKMNAIEKALERIKGYVSINDEDEDVEKDAIDDSTETVEEPKTTNTETNTVKQSGSSFLAGLIKSKPLPSLDIPSIPIEESVVETPVTVLDTAKKSDSFSLKLIETIESCKAKLGISGSELNESIDSESADDEDDEEYEDEEDEDEEDEDEDEEGEDEEGEEVEEDGDKAREDVRVKKRRNKESLNLSDAETSNGDSSESEESDSVSSDTDIETVDIDDSSAGGHQKNLASDSAPAEKPESEENQVSNDSHSLDKDCRDDALNLNEVYEPNKDTTNNQSNATENIHAESVENSEKDAVKSTSDEENDHTENEVDENDCAKNLLENDHTKNVSDVENDRTEDSSDKETNQVKNVSDHGVKHTQVESSAISNKALPEEDIHTSTSTVQTHSAISNVSTDDRSSSVAADLNYEDDDIFICNSPPPRPPTPPLICLDDGTETETENESKSIKNQPTVPSFENPLSGQSLKKADSTDRTLAETIIIPCISNIKLPTNARKSFKRVYKSVSSGESSDDDIQVVSTPSRVPLSGAKRTFSNRLLTSSAKKSKPSEEPSSSNAIASSDRSPREPTPDKVPDETTLVVNNTSSDHSENMEQDTPVNTLNRNSVSEPTSPSNEKDEEIIKLKTKLSQLYTTFQLQHWKHNQEKKELRHNLNLIVMEMRASLEADKKHAIETLSRTFEREKVRCVEEAKKKQWCAYCLQESRYACCWNTSYCTIACQKRHFTAHRKFCTQLMIKKPVKVDGLETKTTDAKEGNKVILLNINPNSIKPSSDSHLSSVQIPLTKVITPSAPLQLVSSSVTGINPSVQFMFSPLRPDESSASQSKPSTTKENVPDSECVGEKLEDPTKNTTSLSTSEEDSSSYKKPDDQGGETSLEEIYFPFPPTVSFEGLDTALPDENVHFNDPDDNSECYVSDTEQPSGDKIEESSGEEDLILSDNDEADNELVSLGHGVDLKAKFLNKCLIYGKTAKRLTRCLVDVLFPDLKLLANCSAFGNKSNVTKLTRAALPSRKVGCIIDYVLKRFPEASKTEIVLAINMKCKEARNIIRKSDTDGFVRKPLFRRLLAKEQKQETSSATPDNTKSSTPVTSKIQKILPKISKPPLVSVPPKFNTTKSTPTTITVLRKSIPNIVCVKSDKWKESTSGQNLTTQLVRPKGPQPLLRFNSQVPIQPKSFANKPVGSKPQTRLLLPPSANISAKGAQTIRQLLDNRSILTRAQGSTSKEGKKILLPLNFIKNPLNSPDVSKTQQDPNKGPRPCIIIGTKASPTSQSTASVSQKSSYSTATIKRK